MLRTPARQAILAASRSTRSSIITRSLSTAPKRASVLPRVVLEPISLSRSRFSTTPFLCAETVKVPQMAESITEGTLKQWNKAVGDFVNQDEEIATIETDKIDVSVNAPMSGTITEFLVDEDSTVTVGQDLLKMEPGEGGGEAPAPSSGEAKSEPKDKEEGKRENAAPAAGKEKDAGDKVLKEQSEKAPDYAADGQSASKEEKPATKKEEAPKKAAPKKEDKSKSGSETAAPKTPGSRNETRVKMSRMRQTIASRLKQSQNTAATLTTFNEIDMSSAMEFRKLYKDQIMKEHGVKLGFMSIFARATTMALRQVPAAAASIEGDQIIYRDFVDLSVAVATPKGLVTPVIRNAETMGLLDLERAIAELGKKARENKLSLEDLQGGFATISNGGVFGSLNGTPILNYPQTVILGMHGINDRAVVRDGQIVIRPIMNIVASYDHRLLDGREAVTFLKLVKEYVEDPRRMLIESPI